MKQTSEQNNPARTISSWLADAVIWLLGLVAFGASLGVPFFWDDFLLIVDNPLVGNWANLPVFFTQQLGTGFGVEYGYYRPLQMLAYSLQHLLWQDWASGYHAVNLGLHLLGASVLRRFLLDISGRRHFALAAACLFAVHPVNSEAVIYISAQSELLAFLGVMLCCRYYLRFINDSQAINAGLSLTFFAMALLSKEVAVITPLLLLSLHLTRRFDKSTWKTHAIFWSLTALFIFVRSRIVTDTFESSPAILLSERLPAFFAAFAHYLRLLVWPMNLSFSYGLPHWTYSDPPVWFGLLLLIALVIGAIALRRRQPLATWAVCWFIIPLLPVSGIHTIGFYMAERYLYLALPGGITLVLLALDQLRETRRGKQAVTLVLTVVIAAFLSRSVLRCLDWRQPIKFLENQTETFPDDARLWDQLGLAYQRNNQLGQARESYHQAITVDKTFFSAYNNFANMLFSEGQFDEAVEYYETSLDINPRQAKVHYNVANALLEIGEIEHAEQHFQQALDLRPEYPKAHGNLAILYSIAGEDTKALSHYDQAIAMDPERAEFFYNRGLLLYRMGRYQEAQRNLDTAQKQGYPVEEELLEDIRQKML